MDIKEIGDQLVLTVKTYVSKATEVLIKRMDDLDAKIANLPVPTNGKDGIDGARGADGQHGKDGANGLDGARGVDGQNGKDGANGIDGVRGADGLPGKDGSNGIDGKDGLPGKSGENGRDGIDGKDGAPGLNGKDVDPTILYKMVYEVTDQLLPDILSKAIESAIPDIISKSVALISKPADGRDGRDGIAGKDGINGIKGDSGENGIDGINGKDGFSPDDLNIETLDGGRTIRVILGVGDRQISKEINLAIPRDRGVYKSGMNAKEGDGVTYGGSWWIAQRDTEDIPGKSDAWRLAVKRGQDGKDLR